MQAKVQTAQIKAEARKAILAPLGLLVFTNVLYESIGGVLQSVVTAVLPEGGISLFILSISLSFIILILLGVLDTGIRSMYLALVFGGTPTGADMFCGFRENTNRIVQVRTLYAVIQTICLFPIQYWLFFSADEMLVLDSGNTSAQETAEIARSVLSSMPPVIIMQTIGFLLLIAVSIRFSIVYYMMLDFPDLSVPEVLRASSRLLQGHVMEFVKLALSFIPLGLMSLISMGIAGFWVKAYEYAAYAAFYKKLITMHADRIRNTQAQGPDMR